MSLKAKHILRALSALVLVSGWAAAIPPALAGDPACDPLMGDIIPNFCRDMPRAPGVTYGLSNPDGIGDGGLGDLLFYGIALPARERPR